jgi:integrase
MARKTNKKINGINYFTVRKTIGKNPDGSPIIKYFYGHSKKEAEEKRDKFMEKINNGHPVDFDKIIFNQLFDEWFKEVKCISLKPSSVERYEQIYNGKITGSTIFNMKLIDIKSIDIQKFYNDVFEINGPDAVKSLDKIVKPFFRYCYEESYLSHQVMKNIKLPQKEEIEEEFYPVLSNDEIKTLSNHVNKNISALIFLFGLLSGARQGEILALTYNDIDLENRKININKTVRLVKNNMIVGRPKSKSSIRKVPLSKMLIPHLKSHIEKEKEKYFNLNIPFSNNSIIFSSTTCEYRNSRNVLRSWYRLQSKLKIEPIDFKGLRHTCCTKLAEKRTPLKTASEILGHSDINITAKYYTHVNFQEKTKAIDTLDSLFDDDI